MARIEEEPLSLSLDLLHRLDDLWHHCEDVTDYAKVCNLEDWCL